MLHLNPVQLAQIEEIINLLDLGFFEGVKSTVAHERTDGNVEFVISLGNTMDRAKGNSKVETTVVVYSSMMVEGQTRHFYASLEEALESVKEWHSKMLSDNIRVSKEMPPLRLVK